MTKLFLCGSALVAAALILACATDNGDAVHGPQVGPPPDRPDVGVDGGPSSDDGGPPPSDGGPASDAPVSTCSAGTIAVLAGNDSSLTGAWKIAGGAWKGAAIAGSAAKNHPSIVPFGNGFLGLTRGTADALQSITFETSWSAALAVGTATTIGGPALAVVGTKAHVVYLAAGAPNVFFRAENGGTSWGVTADPVTAAAVQSFGPSAGTVAAAGAELVFAQNGDDDGLYTQTYDGAWSVAVPIVGAGTLKTAPPSLVAIDGKFDLVLLYVDKAASRIGFATRAAGTKAWSNGVVAQAMALTSAQPQVARISPTTLVVTYLGTDGGGGRPYWMTGTIGASAITWSVPTALLADTSTVDGPPAVAKGVCGDDAIAVFAASGLVKATRLRGSTWSVPEAVGGASGSRVSVSTR